MRAITRSGLCSHRCRRNFLNVLAASLHLNISVLTQMHNVMPMPPNPYTSNPELSPLSNPPDEESFAASEPIAALSSHSRKKKLVKNNTGKGPKGKALPKHRKTVEGSQSRSARVRQFDVGRTQNILVYVLEKKNKFLF